MATVDVRTKSVTLTGDKIIIDRERAEDLAAKCPEFKALFLEAIGIPDHLAIVVDQYDYVLGVR